MQKAGTGDWTWVADRECVSVHEWQMDSVSLGKSVVGTWVVTMEICGNKDSFKVFTKLFAQSNLKAECFIKWKDMTSATLRNETQNITKSLEDSLKCSKTF